MSRWLLLGTALIGAACTGSIVDPDGNGNGPNGGPGGATTTASGELVAVSGLRRLTAAEYDATVKDLLGETQAASGMLLPTDPRTPFDNDYTFQVPSQALIEGAELLATQTADRLIQDPARRDTVVGCTPSGPDDQACFRSFVTSFGKRALRRALAKDEIDRFAALQSLAVEAGDFWVGVESVVRAFLQDPEFLYRVEIGKPVSGKAGIYKLGAFEIASRLSYLIWGSMPNDKLFALADKNALQTGDQRRAAATDMLSDPRARSRVSRFHALWLGYENLPQSAELASAMQAETRGLIERVVFDEKRPWQDLFRSDETYVNDVLAEHYGLAKPGSSSPTWVSYGSSGRRGILSHGTFLSNGAKFSDTSPTLRGLVIRTRLFCQSIADPPPNVVTDEPIPKTGGIVCKKDRYAQHRQGACKSCHDQMDPVGFGLEQFDQMGRYRTVEPDEPSCAIDGEGELVGVGTFHGPGELADLLIQTGALNTCVVTQLYRFAAGRFELDEVDQQLVETLAKKLGSGDFKFDDLLLQFVSSDSFAHRREG